MTHPASLIIAVDGPAASGKGTIARALAHRYGLPHLDTGKLYRATGLSVRLSGGAPEDADFAAAAARGLDPALLDDPDLMSSENAQAASIVSAHPGVRAALLAVQRAFAAQPGGAVLDGRDIGTVIAPHAPAKLFVTATPLCRAQRRHAELARSGDPRNLATVLADIEARDARDSGRSTAPLVRAGDAALLDTTELGIDAAVQRAIALVESAIAAGGQQQV
ncbi:(d)CMP kinase [Polymorphobacter fuscus]|uniref:Cytidylate kinase n=1 Tax=Sandarakinorhabdus fusca TaxID=1439888 RepID=A0A7C9GQF5_9SPHN|nr:(d)CMP kinase [Polymorphobacter fuscus]KAB7644379.1 (d)CMP kinase [Polymorphobacter fuscus]MQT18297.1 (d)CMP kinase [Polymorphobacter fuscus]NJC08192.1 cytidylate kinase [Polymorphobacter fuscus]